MNWTVLMKLNLRREAVLRFATRRALVTAFSLLLVPACTTTLPIPKVPEPLPIMVDVHDRVLPAIDFVNLITDIPGDRIIGYHYEGPQYTRMHDYRWDENYINETKILNDYADGILEEAGYRAGVDDPASLTMVGTIQHLRYNSYDRKISFDQAECTVKWELFAPGETMAIHTQLTEGAARVEPQAAGAIRAAFDLAMRSLLADPKFVAAVSSR